MVVSSAGLRPKSDCSGKAQKQFYSKLQTRPHQRGRYKITNTQVSEGNFKEKEKSVKGPRWAPDTKTDWPTECRSQINFNFNFNFNHYLTEHEGSLSFVQELCIASYPKSE
jgi:hypothetical protein